MKDKRYLVFDFDLYNPVGGIYDRKESFDTISECFEFLKNQTGSFQQIYDRVEGEEVGFLKKWDFKNNQEYILL